VRRVYSCPQCGEVFFSPEDLKRHTDIHKPEGLSFELYKQVFGGASSIFRKKISSKSNEDPLDILTNQDFKNEIGHICVHQAMKRKRAYFNMCVHAIFSSLMRPGM